MVPETFEGFVDERLRPVVIGGFEEGFGEGLGLGSEDEVSYGGGGGGGRWFRRRRGMNGGGDGGERKGFDISGDSTNQHLIIWPKFEEEIGRAHV